MADAGAAPETSLMIGDTSFDMAMARAAGVTAIGVAWGYHDSDSLWRAGAHQVAEHPLDIVRNDQGTGMNSQDNEALWRNRFILINLVRIGGTIVVLLALAALAERPVRSRAARSSASRSRWPGSSSASCGPKWLARRWRTPPAA